MRAKNETRRDFLGKATVAGAALAAGGAVSTARGDDKDEQRRAIPARPGAPFSRAVSFDGVVFVAGVVGRTPGERVVHGRLHLERRRHPAHVRAGGCRQLGGPGDEHHAVALRERRFGEGVPHPSGAAVREVAHVVQVLERRTCGDQDAGYFTPPRVVAIS